MRGAAVLFFFLVVCLFVVAGCQKPTTPTTTIKATATTARPTVTSTTLQPEKTELDAGVSEVSSIENDLDITGLDDMDKDLASLNW